MVVSPLVNSLATERDSEGHPVLVQINQIIIYTRTFCSSIDGLQSADSISSVAGGRGIESGGEGEGVGCNILQRSPGGFSRIAFSSSTSSL